MLFFFTFPGSQANPDRNWRTRRGRGSRGSRGGQGRVRPIRQCQDLPARLGRPKKARPPVRGGGTHQTRHDPYFNPIPGPSWAMQAASAQVPPAAAAAGSAPNQDSGSRRVAVLSQNTVQVSQSPWSPEDDLTDMFADVGDENVDVGNWN